MALKLGELVAYLKSDDTHLARGLKAAQTKMRQLGDKAQQYGPVLGAALAAGIGAGLVGGMDLQSARAELAAQVGDPALAEQLGKAAGAAYGRGFGTDATEAMNAARSLMQAGLLPKNADAAVIEDLTVKAQSLAQVFGQDVTQTARAAGQMVKTGLAKNASEAFDIITRGMQQTGDPAGDLLDTFSEYSTQFRKLGLDGQTAMALLGQGLKGGARDLDIVADAFKEFSIRAIDGSETSAAGFKALGLDAEKMTAQIASGGEGAKKGLDTVIDRLKAMEDPVKRDAAGVALFGTQWEDMGAAMLSLDVDKATNGLGQVAGAANKLGQTVEQSASQKLEAFKRKAQQALIEKLGEAVPYIEKTFGWLQRNSDWVVPLATGLGILAGVIYAITVAMKVWTVVQTILNLALWTSPITWIVLGIIALVAVIVLIATKTDWFQKAWKVSWNAIKAAAKFVFDWIVGGWTWVINTVITIAKTWWSVFSGFWKMIGGFFLSLIRGWWNLFTGFWTGVGRAASSAVSWLVNKVLSFVRFVGSLPGKISAKARGMFDGLKAAFKSSLNWIIGKWNGLSFRIPGISVPGLGQVWGGATLSTPNLPYLAKGGTALAPGLAVVGERGPELAYLNRGATIQPLNRGSAVAGLLQLLLTGEFRIRGGDLVLVLREQVAHRGGNVQTVVGTNQ